MKRVSTLLFVVIFLSACDSATSQPASTTLCGNGACSGPENTENCPADCPVAASTTNSEAGPTAQEPAASGSDAPLYFTTMTHMESAWTDDRDQGIFLRHVEQLRFGMDLAEQYSALLTIESEKPFARANKLWNINMMAEVRDRGFGVGTHCDVGYNEPPMPVEDFARMLVENKSLVDELIGAENNLGCSGGGSVNDWAQAASMVGFKYLDGIVSMHYLSMPMENRPGSEWTDAFIREGHFHYNAPQDLYQRIYLFEVADAKDFVADENPVIVISSGELGLISAIAENGREPGGVLLRDDEYTFDQADVDALVETILAVSQTRDRTRIAKLCVYLPSKIYAQEYEEVLRYFFGKMQELQQQGVMTWATQRQVYEAYVERNQ